MAKEVDYNSLRERLYSKSKIPEVLKENPSRYKLIKERLKGHEPDKESPYMKADFIIQFLGLPKDLYWPHSKVGLKDIKTIKDYQRAVKQIVKKYTKKDVEEAIINELHELGSEGVQLSAGGGRSMYYKKKHMTKYSDIDPRTQEFGESFDTLQKLNSLLSNKRFLKKHGITSNEIKKYQETFKKRVGRLLDDAVEFARTKETKDITMKMLDYAKEEGLINYKKTGLEKSVTATSIVAVIVGLFFLSPNLTGNVIGNLTRNSSNIFGILLLILGVVGVFFTLRKS